ncbi:MAG: MG2 domain-containing protein [Gemmatimonadota bacterium]|nr:MG2 domain-containing protein [Gemmatimonadota bacterium]
MHAKQIAPLTSNRCQAAFSNQSRHKSAATLYKRFVLLSALALSCARVPVEDTRQTVLPETAQLVSTVTSGTVSSGDVIKVRFVKPAIDASLVGHTLKKQVFTFTPPIDGITQWETTQALVFLPNHPLPMRQPYQGHLDLAALLPARADLQPLHFNFAVAGREILSLEGDFDLKTANDPRYLIYQGRLELTEKADVQKVREAATLRRDKTLLPLTWQADATGKVFTFTSTVIERDATLQSYALIVDDETLEISHLYEKDIPLAPLQDMRLQEIKKEEEGDYPRLILIFSDELDPRQHIEGLVQVRPEVPVRLKATGKQILVDGDFAHGQTYELQVHAGIRSRWGTRTEEATRQEVGFADRKPQLRFARDGMFLPSSKDKRLRFATLNLHRVALEVKKVYASNLGQFLQTERLHSGKERRDSFQDYFVRRVGVQVARDTLEISDQRNTWLEHELDLGALIAEDEQGLFLIGLSFGQDDMLYRSSTSAASEIRQHYRQRNRGQRNAYYSDPNSPGYIRAHGRAYKTLIVSDIGLTYKRGHDQHIVYATRIDDAQPLAGAEVRLRTYQNQVAARGTTDDRGLARFEDVGEEIFYVEAEHQGQRSVIKPNDMAWNLSSFDIGGAESRPGIRAFIYTERGVYRPGDEINISVIARHQDYTFPDDHPATCKIFNPRNQMVFEQVQRQGREGLYNFAFATRPEDPTGNWRAQILIGDSTFDHVLKIETVVPYRLKTEITTAKERLGRGDEILSADLHSTYLFGNPAAGLEAELAVSLHSVPKTFPDYRAFSFTNELIDYQPVAAVLFKGQLDAKGSAHIEWTLPPLVNAPSALQAVLDAKVLEKGGRPNHRRHRLPMNPYDHYVGLKKPEFDYGYTRVGVPVQIPAIVTDVEGNPVAGRNLRYRVYRGMTHWWWEYENREAFQRRFKSDRRTELVSEERVVSALAPIDLLFKPDDRGEYLIEVADGDDKGHTAAFFVRAYHWGRTPSGEDNEGALVLRTDRERYQPGDEAVIRFPVPQEGSVLFAVEQGGRVIESRWYRLDGTQEEAKIPIAISAAMIPTAYASVSLIQPHAQTDNDRPMRLFGVVPIEVHDPATRLDFDIHMPDLLRPDEPFTVEVQSDADSAAFTIAVVDEGLLALTDFRTPDPYESFFQKQRLSVRTFDLFAHVIGVAKGDPFKTFAIGGGFAAKQREQRDPRRRFPSVSMFAGPLHTDATGHARVQFTMPNYVGAVRTMVVGARGKRFGHAEKTTEVKSDLMVLSTLPRVIGPGDRIEVPVTAFAMAESLGTVEVSIAVRGPLAIVGEAHKRVDFAGAGERDLSFRLQADQAVGSATVVVEATATEAHAARQTHLEVRPSSPPIYESTERGVRPGESVSFTVPHKGMPGTNQARISVRRWPNFNFDNQMLRLVRYPYGCLEQTVSSVFPQLYLKDLLDLKPEERRIVAADIDERINEAILRLRRFQLPDNSFSLWPGQRRLSAWGSTYAGHFLIEARSLGYHIPDDMLQGWLRHQHTQATLARDHLKVRAYRVYLLALAGDPALGAMNLLKENALDSMTNVEKWLLAAAYLHAGIGRTANEITRTTGVAVEDYREFANTYGSGLRDEALILDALVAFQRWDAADSLAKEVAHGISKGWHSTQTTSVALLALGKYVQALQQGSGPPAPLTGHIRLPGGEPIPFSTDALGYQQEITSGFGEQVEVRLDSANTVERAFVALDWEGIPLRGEVQDEEGRIRLRVEWLDEDGMRIAPDTLAQGTTFWGHIRVENRSPHHVLEEVALTQLLPAGWEIENTRLSSKARPGWMKKWRLNAEEYLDIRDDRINWFFDLPRRGQALDFAVKLNTVTQGAFSLPPTQVEAMYDRDFRARKASGTVVVGP